MPLVRGSDRSRGVRANSYRRQPASYRRRVGSGTRRMRHNVISAIKPVFFRGRRAEPVLGKVDRAGLGFNCLAISSERQCFAE